LKRFYKDVALAQADGGWRVTLDGRAIRTARGAPQIVPSRALAEAMAQEWSEQSEVIDPQGFALRDLADYAIDVIAAERAASIAKLLGYGETDTLLYRAEPGEPLFARQEAVWEPIVAAFEAHEGVALTRVSGVLHRPQGEPALAAFAARLERCDAFALAAIEAMTSLAASLLVALAASETDSEAEAQKLWRAASLEEEWQAQLWGRDEEAEARRARREADFLSAHRAARLALALAAD
jgi:chaperone required for assembly of F1-ATPase